MKTKTIHQSLQLRAAMTLLVTLLAGASAWAQYVAIYADPYSAGMVQVGTEMELDPFSDGASFVIAEAGETIYFSYEPFSDYRFKGIRYKNLSSDQVTEHPNGIYSFTMPSWTEDEFWVSIFIEFEKKPVIVTGVDINEDNFPDENFRKWLLSQSYGKDAVITDAEMATITKIEARSCGIKDLTGIALFTELTELSVGNNENSPEEDWNKITTLDLSGNTKLRKLWVNNNQLQSLDLSNCPELRNLDCTNNALTKLDVTSNPLLSLLYCDGNQLATLDVTLNTNLAVLSCQRNQLKALDVTHNMSLEQLYCENNQLAAIDVTNHEKLMIFNCNNNQLTSFDVTGCPGLFQLYCYNNQIKGQAMDVLVNSLPYFQYAYMVVLDLDSEIEQNAITKEQIAVAREKGWSVEGISGEDFLPLGESDEHEYVDLGLPSGTLWATCNVGASKPQETGDFFAWGETTGHGKDTSDGYLFNWDNYKWGESSGVEFLYTKYCSDSSQGLDGFTDGKVELDPEDDAAYVNWGSQWRTPTKEQLDELRNVCTWTKTTIQGVNGYEVKGSNGNTIFLPEAGWRLDDMLLDGGAYWSRTTNPEDAGGAYYLGFDDYGWYEFGARVDGQCVRPVFSSSKVIELVEDTDNSEAIQTAAASGEVCDVKLVGRTFYKDGSWNTLCLPFAIDDFKDTPLQGATVKTLTSSSFEKGILTLVFSDDLTAIEAGKPYIVRWKPDNSVCDIENPVFQGVKLSKEQYDISTEVVTFKGLYKPLVIAKSGDKTKLYIGVDNKLQYPEISFNINAFHGCFQMGKGLVVSSLGDVNGDKQVNVTDVTMLINQILGLPANNFIIGNADVNIDGTITVTDVTSLVDIILGVTKNLNVMDVMVKGADGFTFEGGGSGPARAKLNK